MIGKNVVSLVATRFDLPNSPSVKMIHFPEFKLNVELGCPESNPEHQEQLKQEPAQPNAPRQLTLRSLQPVHLDLSAATTSPIKSSAPLILVEPPAPTSPEFPASHDTLLGTPSSDSNPVPDNYSLCPVCEIPVPLPLNWDANALLQDPMKEMYRSWEEMMLEIAGKWNAKGKKERAAASALMKEMKGHLEVEMERLEEFLRAREIEP